jgi:hypothetical protein
MPYGVYGAWLVIDFRLMWMTIILSIGLSLIVLALFVRNRRWHEYITLFVAISTIVFLLVTLVLIVFFGRSVIMSRDFFLLQ